MQLTVARDMDSLQESLADIASQGLRVGLVPTMGALHAGHMSLIKQASQITDVVVVSIFVNPTQFGPNEDFAKYPRMLEADLRKCDQAGASLAYTPSPEDIYPAGFSTSVSAGPLSTILEGKSRPGHFDGVATIVTKLLLRTLPAIAIFGEKDYQQLCIIRRIVSDLDIPVEIIGAPTLRDSDGLAMSSRNAYLSDAERAIAPKLHETMVATARAITSGGAIQDHLARGVATLNAAGFNVDYLELRDADTLDELERYEAPARLLAAAKLGNTRLIDNIPV